MINKLQNIAITILVIGLFLAWFGWTCARDNALMSEYNDKQTYTQWLQGGDY